MSGVHIELNRSVCIGAARCSDFAPGTFTQDDEGLVVLIDPAASSLEDLRTAEYNCPSGAITISEGEQV